ncbi:tyrosine-protein phosphatase [Singulisphaera sp. GP187]|uniref:tyrosine-protein phosphatase n=1 Tax=Singulisphaera sp. GP187 TaxID=1882752 RepID=UPI0020B175F8|nr:tyrosine-protein phosphatase [Singulisphaera sp. GP187]
MVQSDRVYRSGQMPAANLARAVRDHRIKTVLNLRGANPDQSWYPAERATTLAAGATQIDLSMASDMWLSRNQARTVLKVLDTCTYPILIHCQWGSERTGLVSAITELLRPGGSLADARRQFSLVYLYVKAGDGAVMERHLDRYEHWLKAGTLAHSPKQFRHWITQEFRPESPSREEWPYDPYPPVIITRPSPAASPTAQLAAEDSVSRQ